MRGKPVKAVSKRLPLADRLHPVPLLVTIAALSLIAWVRRFIEDDAFISFRYASHLARGLGLVWNPGERVEGYTNFLWTVAMAVPHLLGLDPVGFSQALGVAAFAGTLAVTWSLARGVLGSGGKAMLVIVLLGLNATFSAYATGGLETQLQTLLVTAALWMALLLDEHPTPRKLLALSLVGAAALLTRLDSAIPIAFALVVAAIRLLALPSNARARAFAALLVPLGAILSIWLVWKFRTYGDLLPNTFYAKTSAHGMLKQGARYVGEFMVRYGFFVVAIVLVARARSVLRDVRLRWLLAAVTAWTLYVIATGGDFMEFRFMVPLLPAGMILAVAAVSSLPRYLAASLFAGMLAASVVHSTTFRDVAGIESVGELQSHVTGEENWRGIGRTLRTEFGGTHVMIATSAAGAIPYESDLPCIDMLGLCDHWVARHGLPLGNRPGHRRIATHQYLHDRGVNLLIGHPVLNSALAEYRPEDLSAFGLMEIQPALLPASARVIEMPIEGTALLIVLYLEPSADVERVIRERGWVTHRVVNP